MSEGETGIFYHVDEHGDLDAGDSMELEWPPQLKNEIVVEAPDLNEDILEEEFRGGLSRHGAKYAPGTIVCTEGFQLSGAWKAMSGMLECIYTDDGDQGRRAIEPHQVHYEWMIEMVRRAEFENQMSRFQSFFAWPDLEDAEAFIEENRTDGKPIFKVECDGYKIRDMNLTEIPYFGIGLDNARKYWAGDPGSDSPTWEVVMEPPVEVLERI